MPQIIDLSGNRVGHLTVLYRGEDKIRPSGISVPRWVCRCDCGNLRLIEGSDLRRKTTVTCGCHYGNTSGHKNKIHGLSKTPEYRSWLGINRRIYDVSCKDYKNYGGRGIKVDHRWSRYKHKGFNNFLNDMGKMPDKSYSIERIDVNKGYTKDNCKWIKNNLQSRNTRRVKKLEYKDIVMNQTEWADVLGVFPAKLAYHIKSGKTFEEVIVYICKKRKDCKDRLKIFMEDRNAVKI